MLHLSKLRIGHVRPMRIHEQCLSKAIGQKLDRKPNLPLRHLIHPPCEMQHHEPLMVLVGELHLARHAALKSLIGLNALSEKFGKCLHLILRHRPPQDKVHRQKTAVWLVGHRLNLRKADENGREQLNPRARLLRPMPHRARSSKMSAQKVKHIRHLHDRERIHGAGTASGHVPAPAHRGHPYLA